ncbi:MAG: carboxypeptidase-like regulatory domain-containing protein, partial [Nitrospiraceae bacterium]|nr:carboxypeptidase-like regulatory domain-containing protein [Nitrospiraceae bacterium]
ACGGGGGSSSPAPVATTTITGTVFAAPVRGARVSAKNASGYTVAGPVTTSSDGAFSIDVPTVSLSGDLRIESEEGTYLDEATGETTTAGRLAAFAPSGSLRAGSSVNLDPSSTIICDLVTGQGKTLAEANTIFTSAFGYTPDTSVSPINAPSPGTDKSQSLAGLRAIAFSQLTYDLGLGAERQFDMLAALGQDLSDGILDGKNGTAPVMIVAGAEMPEDIQNKFEDSLLGLLANTAVNQTGLTADQVGALPFSKTVMTAGYKVEYIPGAMAAAQGKTMFTIRLTDRTTGKPAAGKAVGLMPKMHMASMSHSAPVGAVIDNNDGTYSCTVYYLMASGPGMGIWELKVTIGGMSGESATFYPSVGMSMGTTSKANLKGVADLIPAMGGTGTTSRTYPLFYDGMSGGMGGSSTFRLFIAASDDMMLMKWPAVSIGTTLHDQNGTAWTVNSMTVEASTDKSAWLPGTDDGNGHWSVPGLTGLSSGGAVYVRVVVNGEQKTTDGKSVSGDNGYQTFTVVSGM